MNHKIKVIRLDPGYYKNFADEVDSFNKEQHEIIDYMYTKLNNDVYLLTIKYKESLQIDKNNQQTT